MKKNEVWYETKIAFNKFWVRLSTAYRILFRKHNHWFLVNLSEPDLRLLLQDKLKEIRWMQHGLQQYNVIQIMKLVADNIDDDEMILKKADFEAHSELLHDKQYEDL